MPARTWTQRAPTAGLDDATAMPNMPVRSQRAAIDKVIGAPARGSPAAAGAGSAGDGHASTLCRTPHRQQVRTASPPKTGGEIMRADVH
jgi:hypothetical protein